MLLEEDPLPACYLIFDYIYVSRNFRSSLTVLRVKDFNSVGTGFCFTILSISWSIGMEMQMADKIVDFSGDMYSTYRG
jgi:hypothetical protein